jgi:hypothetical protein
VASFARPPIAHPIQVSDGPHLVVQRTGGQTKLALCVSTRNDVKVGRHVHVHAPPPHRDVIYTFVVAARNCASSLDRQLAEPRTWAQVSNKKKRKRKNSARSLLDRSWTMGRECLGSRCQGLLQNVRVLGCPMLWH